MARTLDADAAAEKDKNATAPAVILKIDFPGPVGTKYYSDRAITVPGLQVESRIVDCGRIRLDLAAGRRPSVDDARIALRDEDGALRSILEPVEIQGSSATIYQHFDGLGSSTMTPLLAGVAAGDVEYREDEGVLAFDVTDISRKWAVDIGRAADTGDFPNMDPRDRGRMLPVVFGRMKHSRAVCVRSGRRGKLLRDCDCDDATLYISGFEDLPDGTSLTIEIGRERITGTISGTAFSVTSRGGGTIASGTTTHATGRQSSIRDSGLGGVDNEYVGYCLKIWITGTYGPSDIPYEYRLGGAVRLFNPPTAGYEYRLIRRFDASTGTIEYWPPFTVEGTRSETPALTLMGVGHAKLVSAGTAYTI
ncbi:MAG: hypothetical protein ACYS9X_32750, partial [Planctomycetota bacterium]